MSDFYVQRCQQLEFANHQLLEEKRSLTAQLHEKINVESKLRQCQIQIAELHRRLRDVDEYRKEQSTREKKADVQTGLNNRDHVAGSDQNGFTDQCTCGAKEKLQEVMAVNSQWKGEYELLERNLQAANIVLEEVKMKNNDLKTQKLALESELSRLAHALGGLQQKLTAGKSEITVEDIVLIREQLQAYQDDFQIERRDRERVQGEKDSLREQLQTAEVIISSLREELELCRSDVQRISEERDLFQRRLTATVQQASYGMPVSSQPQLQIVYPINASGSSPQQQRRTSPQNAYGASRQQGVVSRGGSKPPDNFFYGGDVEVDS